MMIFARRTTTNGACWLFASSDRRTRFRSGTWTGRGFGPRGIAPTTCEQRAVFPSA
jgi:hypothetical protein